MTDFELKMMEQVYKRDAIDRATAILLGICDRAPGSREGLIAYIGDGTRVETYFEPLGFQIPGHPVMFKCHLYKKWFGRVQGYCYIDQYGGKNIVLDNGQKFSFASFEKAECVLFPADIRTPVC